MIATGVPTRMVGHVWHDLWPLLEPAYRKSTLKVDILREVYARRCTVWAVYAKDKPVAGIVSRKLARDGTSSFNCHLWLVGGCGLSEWAPDFITKLIPWARGENCSAITGSGRRGWSRIVRRFGGYRIEDEDGQPAWRLDI